MSLVTKFQWFCYIIFSATRLIYISYGRHYWNCGLIPHTALYDAYRENWITRRKKIYIYCKYTWIYIVRFVVHSLANARCRIVLLSLLILNFTVSEVLKRILRFMSLRVRTEHGPLYTSHRVTGTHFIIAWREINSTARNRKIWLFKRVKYLWLIKFSELPVSPRARVQLACVFHFTRYYRNASLY